MKAVTVWKYEIEVVGYVERELPKDAQILAVDVQYGKPYFWALVQPDAELETRHFYLFGTGHAEIYDGEADVLRHLGTFMLDGGAFVGHLFELRSIREQS